MAFTHTEEQNRAIVVAFENYIHHSSGQRTATNLVYLQDLRKSYLNHNITSIPAGYADFLGYAKTGNATAILHEDSLLNHNSPNPPPFHTQLQYQGPTNRLTQDAGKIAETTQFGKYDYTADGYKFEIHKLVYTLPNCGNITEYFIITPKTDKTTDGGHLPSIPSILEPILLKIAKWTSELHNEVYVFDGGRWTKSPLLWKAIESASWDDVILDKTTKSAIINDVEHFYDRKDLYAELNVPWKRGIIFHGLPGNGKTVSIKALMGTLAARAEPIPSLYVKSLQCQNGEQYSILSIFTLARRMAPCLLIFEDLDSLVTEKARSYFLNEVDGLESNDGILIIGSTNHLDTLDPAIAKRPSRFDRKYHFRLPNDSERLAYAEYWRNKLRQSKLVDYADGIPEIIAKLTDGFSFAYLKELFVMTLLLLAHGGESANEEDTIEEDLKREASTASDNEGSEKSTDTKDMETGAVIVKHVDVKIAAGGQTKAKATAVKKDPSALLEKLKAQSEIAIPKHLQDNVFLKVLRKQSRILLLEMDNTDEDEWKSSKAPVDMNPMVRQRMALAMRMQAAQ